MTNEQAVNKKIGKTIARKRMVADLTQEQVAEHLGIGQEAYSRIERGMVSPGIFKLYELADLFDCGVESFLVEGSKRPVDQAAYISQMLTKNTMADRQLIIAMIEKLSSHLSGKKSRAPKDED